MAKRLGKGLEALIPQLSADEHDAITEIPIDELRPNPYQPRRVFDDASLAELANSIREHGVVQPIIVRKGIKGYDIVAGERRWRAAKLAGLTKIPAVVKVFTEEQVMEIALIENLQREDLNPIEIAQAYQKLMETFNLTQEELAQKVGKSRPHVANFLRLLTLPKAIQDDVSRGTLSMGHARALLGVEDDAMRMELAKQAVRERWSVRELEARVQRLRKARETARAKRAKPVHDPVVARYEDALRAHIGTAVKIRQLNKKGKIEIEYLSREDLHRIVALIVGRSADA
ncbi:ParB/RepB/Spo0J family partition protein [Calditerricola satsumensis]|uniref:Stage 0 sporulation protein J n=1 Tax=Calditerricola satsumensis TaxID=373054 RepID=A0A8J3FBS0_9BACI|nr:ParB/RepB/Spo0J family partition protein [Calditerricola satsumensis]GGJ97268.1 stage 0 sporulation protein J [Calditerricola satsumensis]